MCVCVCAIRQMKLSICHPCYRMCAIWLHFLSVVFDNCAHVSNIRMVGIACNGTALVCVFTRLTHCIRECTYFTARFPCHHHHHHHYTVRIDLLPVLGCARHGTQPHYSNLGNLSTFYANKGAKETKKAKKGHSLKPRKTTHFLIRHGQGFFCALLVLSLPLPLSLL